MHKARPREPMVASRIHRTERAWADAREPALQFIWNTTTDLEVEGGGLLDHRGEVAAEVRILRCTRLGRYFQIASRFCDCHFQVSLWCGFSSLRFQDRRVILIFRKNCISPSHVCSLALPAHQIAIRLHDRSIRTATPHS